jgi:hypothetical protein
LPGKTLNVRRGEDARVETCEIQIGWLRSEAFALIRFIHPIERMACEEFVCWR